MAKKAEFSIETVKKYIFWVCVPLGLILAAVATWLAVAGVTKAFNDQKQFLQSQKQAVERIRGESNHPNERTIEQIANRRKDLRGRVFQAWTTLSRDQRERNQWPEAVGPLFNEEVSRLKFGDEISIDSLEAYLNFIERYLPELEYDGPYGVNRRRTQVKLNGEWKDIDPMKDIRSGSGPTGRGPMSGADDPYNTISRVGTTLIDGGMAPGATSDNERVVGVVDWDSPETRTVVLGWDSLPKSNEVWYAQEDLWVYGALISVIRKTNTNATGPHNAAIKRIESMLIGQAASALLHSQLQRRIGGGGGGVGMDDGLGGGGSPGGLGGPDNMMGMGTGGGRLIARTEADVANMKRHNRYVKADGSPLPYNEAPPFSQFNRMPVVLRMIVDQRKIPEFLVNCANSDMPIDVLRVCINPGSSKPFELSSYDPSAGLAEGGGSGGGSGMPSGGDYGSGVGYGGAPSGSGRTSGSGDDSQIQIDGIGGIYGSNAVPIEIYGCINIFNPVEHTMTPAQDATE